MACSEKKRLSNAANSLKSTGPKSKEGKRKVALNSLKHGLRSPEVLLPGEDHAAFDAMLGAWVDDWQPPTEARRVLVEQCMAHAWRLRRCLKLERDHLVKRGQDAAHRHERESAARVAAAVKLLGKQPDAALKTLCNERQGVVALIGLWDGLAEAAGSAATWWDMVAHHTRLLNLLGFEEKAEADAVGGAVWASWCLIEWNEPEPTAYAVDCPADAAAADAMAAELSAFIAGEVAKLRTYLRQQFATPEQIAARLASEAALDDSAEGRALLRYEGQHGREFRATLNQLIKLTQTGIDLVEGDETEAGESPQAVAETTVEPATAPAPSKATEPEAVAPSKATEAEPAAPSKATEAVSEAPSAPSKATATAPEPAPTPVEDDAEERAKDKMVGDAISGYLARVGKSRSNR